MLQFNDYETSKMVVAFYDALDLQNGGRKESAATRARKEYVRIITSEDRSTAWAAIYVSELLAAQVEDLDGGSVTTDAIAEAFEIEHEVARSACKLAGFEEGNKNNGRINIWSFGDSLRNGEWTPEPVNWRRA